MTNGDYLLPGYNAWDEPFEMEGQIDENEEAFLRAMYEDYYTEGRYVDDGVSREDLYHYAREEEALCEMYEGYYLDGTYLEEGFTREDLLDWLYYNGYDEYYGYGNDCCEPYQISMWDYEPMGTKAPLHSISHTIKATRQNGPKCSAFAASHLLKFYGVETDPDKLYKKFMKLPDGSALPASVAKKTGTVLCSHGTLPDLEKMIDQDKPVMILGYYDKEQCWDNLHYMLVTGYDDEYIYLIDSLCGGGECFYNRKVKRRTFKKMWNTSSNTLVRTFYGKNVYYDYNNTRR